ncbi:response regulator [Pontibacter harenae]|uniref:response regulator n=1 Tax=Pontibacter harenae TaxID=2894083 RepID=UPI001E5A9AC6|nr:response regulator [Pontibacter harenae]MCC9167228.1 response regulator [Pontibacter harenae]
MSLKVFLVDDDDMIIYLHKMVVKLSQLSDTPFCFSDGKKALDYLFEHYDTKDNYLILLDIKMPVMDGWSFLESIQTKQFDGVIAVVMVTSSIDKADRDKAFQYRQVIDYLEKPLSSELCRHIMQLPQVRGYFDRS